MFTESNQKKSKELLDTILFFYQKGWCPATATNFSARTENPEELIISRSGVDKSNFTLQDFILINPEGEILPPCNRPGIKSSAETEIHTMIYKRFPEVGCVLHTHSVLGTVLSRAMAPEEQIVFEGWEILKAFEGNTTHEMTEILPIVSNSQVISEINNSMANRFASNVHGFLIAGHGLYTWGKDISTAKRHVETYEFLFECLQAMGRN